MNPWRPYPLIRLATAFVAGIISAVLRLSETVIPTTFLAALLIPVLVLAAFPGFLSSYRLRWVRGVFIFVSMATLGNQYTLDYLPAYFQKEKPVLQAGKGIIIARITEQPQRRTKSIRLTTDLWLRDSTYGSFRAISKGLLYMQKDQKSECLQTGDLLLIAGDPSLLPLPGIPGGFDMRSWFSRKGIFYQLYIPSANWKFLSGDTAFSVRRIAEQVRNKLLLVLKENNVTGEEFTVAAALLLGYVSEIDRELLSDYSSSGAMHILSVSGMHVGVIYLFLEFLLGFLERRRRNGGIASWLKAALMVVSIWTYAVLTGLSPPVHRAAIMLSMIIIGKNMKRQPDILNILAASLFIVLISDPFLVTDIGCQFSYLAVAGIVLLYKPVYDLHVTSRWFLDKLWSLVAVSIAAQLVTFPLGLYMFHQFPNYFLLTNILAVPLSSIIIYQGILLLAVSPVPWLGPLTGKALSWLVWLLNQIVRMIDSLPGSTLKGIFPTLPEMFLLYVIVACVFLYFLMNKKRWLYMFLVSLVLFSASSLLQKLQNRGRKEILVCHGRSTVIDLISGNHHFLLMQSPLEPLDQDTRSRMQDNYTASGIDHHYSGYLYPGMIRGQVQNAPVFMVRKDNFVLFGDTKLVVLNRTLPSGITRPFETDLLVISGDPKMKLADIIKVFQSEQIVVDGSNAPWRVAQWEKEAKTLGIRLHLTAKDGLFRSEE